MLQWGSVNFKFKGQKNFLLFRGFVCLKNVKRFKGLFELILTENE